MALSEFGALTREFYIAEIGTWENYCGRRVWRFIEGRFNQVLDIFLLDKCASVEVILIYTVIIIYTVYHTTWEYTISN